MTQGVQVGVEKAHSSMFAPTGCLCSLFGACRWWNLGHTVILGAQNGDDVQFTVFFLHVGECVLVMVTFGFSGQTSGRKESSKRNFPCLHVEGPVLIPHCVCL